MAETKIKKYGDVSANVIDAVEEEGWGIVCCEKQGDEYIMEIESYSDLGEDLIEDIWFDGTNEGFRDGVKNLYERYDADEHAEPLVEIRGTHGVPNSIRALIEDAEGIEDMLESLAEAVCKAVAEA